MIRKPVKEPSSLAKSLPQTILDDYRVVEERLSGSICLTTSFPKLSRE